MNRLRRVSQSCNGHGDLPQGHVFRHIPVGGDQPLQLSHFVGCEIVFGHHIELLDFTRWCFFPGGEAHVVFPSICPVANDFRSGLAVNGPMQLVLHRGKETLGGGGGEIVIGGGGVNVSVFLVKLTLAEPNLFEETTWFGSVGFSGVLAIILVGNAMHAMHKMGCLRLTIMMFTEPPIENEMAMI
jgi:hypothetical protein